MGFCGGVDRAIRMAEAALAEEGEAWSVGSIIHNENVMNDLKAKGLKVADSLEEVPDGKTVIVRSHGEGPDFFREAEAKKLKVVDATCQKVARIHELVRDADARGEHVVIVGDEGHPEVQATKAWGGGERAAVINAAGTAIFSDLLGSLLNKSPNDSRLPAAGDSAANIETPESLFVVAQTTFDEEAFEEIAACFREKGAIVNDTICEATALRQDACRKLAEKVDIVLTIGDSHSSNTKKLYEIAKSHGTGRVVFAQNNDEISLKDLCGYGKLGITAGASTPKHVIEEVISSMSEFKGDNYEDNPMHEFMDEIDKSTRLPRNGDIVTGEVIQVTDNEVTVNLGCKKDGVIPKNEVGLEEGQTLHDAFKEGDEVQTKVMKNDDGEGNILLSKKRVVVSEHWDTIIQAYEEKTPVEVKVIREVNGGVIVAFNEVNGFIPLSQLSDRYIENAEEFIGQTLLAKVIRVDQKRNKVVLSHKAVLNEERQRRMQEMWDHLAVGDVIEGSVMRFTDYGAFIDIGGVDGLLHISEISWGKLRHPSDMLEINQKIQVKILSMNKEKEKISLGYKQNQPEPWSVINDKYEVGQVIAGKAVQIKDYGVFVEIEPGLDGLVHISEIAFRRVTDITEELDVGQEVSAKILEIDSTRKRISLSIKETLEKPTEEELAAAEAERAEAAAEEAAAAEAAVEEAPAEEAVAEEAAAEEAVAEEAAPEEAAAEEAPAEEAAPEEALAEEVAEEAATAEEVVEAIEEVVEEAAETITQALEEIIEEVEELFEEVAEAIEEVAEEIVAEAAAEEEAPEEAPAEEAAAEEEVAAQEAEAEAAIEEDAAVEEAALEEAEDDAPAEEEVVTADEEPPAEK